MGGRYEVINIATRNLGHGTTRIQAEILGDAGRRSEKRNLEDVHQQYAELLGHYEEIKHPRFPLPGAPH